MDQTTQTIIDSASGALAAAAPTLIAGAAVAGAVANPQAATAIATLAPVALQLLQNASLLQQAGAMSDAQLAQLFVTVGQGIQATHDSWTAMNAATPTAKA